MLSVVMLNVIMLSVVAPINYIRTNFCEYKPWSLGFIRKN